MRFWIRTGTVKDLYYADENDKETCERCLSERIEGRCYKSRYAYSKGDNKKEYIFCFEKNATAKQAKHIAKLTYSAFDTIKKAAKADLRNINKIQTVAYHNAKKLNASIGQKLDKIFPEISSSPHGEKIEKIVLAIEKDRKSTATDLLSVRKTVEHIESEYNLIEVLDIDKPYSSKDLIPIRAHKLIVSAYYLFQEEFGTKRLFVDIVDTDVSLRVDYGLAKSAITQILNNGLKYCLPNTEIKIVTLSKKQYVEIQFFMTSLMFDNDEVDRLKELGGRGDAVSDLPGEGVGLFAVNKFMEKHKGYFKMHCGGPGFDQNGKSYSNNVFTLGFCKI